MLTIDWDWLSRLFGHDPSIPPEFRDLAKTLDGKLTAFEAIVDAGWSGAKAPVVFTAELMTANANRGMQLLDPNAIYQVNAELAALQALGIQAVSIAINFPILYAPFLEYNVRSADYARFLDFYRTVASNARNRGMKIIVDNAVIFTGFYSAECGLDVAGYYRTILTGKDLAIARAQTANTIAVTVQPDFLNLGSEPDTQAEILQSPYLATPAVYTELIKFMVQQLRAAGVKIPLGAGVGTWAGNAAEFVTALGAIPELDTIDFHLYPINFTCLSKIVELAALAKTLGKQTSIGECWLLKERDNEYSTVNVASNPVIMARDPFSFWAPLDTRFLTVLTHLAHWQQLTYFSAFWSRYFWAYIEYGDAKRMDAPQITVAASQAAADAIRAQQTTSTGHAYAQAIS